jgi:hypothetical protein
MKEQVFLPNCRRCPSSQFKLPYVCQSRYMGICDAKHLVLHPIFDSSKPGEDQFINKANVDSVQFELPDNCPHLEQMRKDGLVPWACGVIDFLGKRK